MATSSFDTILVIDSDEVAQRLIDLIEAGDQGPPVRYIDVDALLKESEDEIERL
jgi:hypothetical protein